MDVPEGWQKTVLSEVAEVRLGRQRSPSRAVGPNMRPYLRAANIGWGQLKLDDVKEMDFTPAEYEIYALRPGDILLNEASGSSAEVGKPAVYRGEIEGACFQNTILRVRAKAEANVEFLFQLLMQTAQHGDLGDSSAGTNIQHIGRARLAGWPVDLPPLAEQKKIAEILGSVDEAIQATQTVVDQTRKVKQGLLQQLLTRGIGHTRFKQTEIGEIPESWEVVEFGSLGAPGRPFLRTGPFGSSMKSEHFTKTGTPVLTIQSLGVGYVEEAGLFFVGDEKAKELAEYAVQPGDLVFSRVADIGRSVVIPPGADGWIISSNLMRICPDPSRISSLFLMYSIVGGGPVTTQIEQLSGSSGRPVVSSSVVKKIRFPLPPLEEQVEMAGSIRVMEEQHLTQKAVLERTQTLKAGLMNDLLSGRVRVQVPA